MKTPFPVRTARARRDERLRTASLPLGLALGLSGIAAHAAPVEFADDFSAESLRFTVDRRPDERSTRTYEVLEDRVRIAVSATSEDDQGQAELDVWGRSDAITTRVSLDVADVSVDPDARAMVRIAGQFWNDTADGGFDGRTGDVYAQLRLQARGDGSREASICLDRETTADGGNGEGLQVFEENRNCESFPDFVPELGVEYTLSMFVDRAAGVLTYSVDDMVRSVALGQPVFLPSDERRGVQVTQEGPPGQAVGTVYAIATDAYTQDFATDAPIIGPYRPFFDLQDGGRSMAVVDGRARLEVESDVGGNERVSINVAGETDRIETVLELSSESALAGGSDPEEEQLHMSLGGAFYNDTADGGFNDEEGQVFAEVKLQQFADTRLRIVYCLFRSNTADFSDALALLPQGDDACTDSGVEAALDTPYLTSLSLDRDAGTLTFTAGEADFVYAIATPIFSVAEDRQFIRARARAWNGSRAVGFLDDYRTSADAPLVAGSPAAMEPTDGTDGTPVAPGTNTTTDPVGTDDTGTAGGSSGGGCSIGGRGGDGATWLLGMLAAAGLALRRRRAVLR